MADSKVSSSDKVALIPSSDLLPSFVGRPIVYYSFLDALPALSEYAAISGASRFFGSGSSQNGPTFFSSFNDQRNPANVLGKAAITQIFGMLSALLNVQFRRRTDLNGRIFVLG